MTDRKIITWEQYLEVNDWTPISNEIRRKEFDELPDAPKHTDEEYEELKKEWDRQRVFSESCIQFEEHKVEIAEARIKELEKEKAQLELRLDKCEVD